LSDPAVVTCTAFFSNIDDNFTESVCVSVNWSSTGQLAINLVSHLSVHTKLTMILCFLMTKSFQKRLHFHCNCFTVGPFNDLSILFQIVCFHPCSVSVNTKWDKCPTSLFSYVSSTLSVHNLCIYFQYSLCTWTNFLHIFRAIKSSTNVMQMFATMPESTHTAADFQVKGI